MGRTQQTPQFLLRLEPHRGKPISDTAADICLLGAAVFGRSHSLTSRLASEVKHHADC